MTIALIGASGRTGTEFGRAAMAAGHQVIAVVRDASRVTFPATSIAVADARQAAQLAAAILGADAVVSAVGPSPTAEHGIVTESATATLLAMASSGIRRLVFVSATGPFTEGDNFLLGRVLKPIVQRILRKPFADIAEADALIQASDTDWTILRPPQLSEATAKGTYKRDPSFGMRITRGDLALAMLDALEDAASVRRVISVAN